MMKKIKAFFKKIGAWLKKKFADKAFVKMLWRIGFITAGVLVALFVVDKTIGVIEAILGKTRKKKNNFVSVPGEKYQILVQVKDGWQKISLKEIGLKAEDVMSVHYREGETPIADKKHKAKDRKNKG